VNSLFLRGIEEFNAGSYFEAHDLWEELWVDTRGEARLFYQGLIQTAVGFYHLLRQNYRGASSQLGKALNKLETYPASYQGIDTAKLCADLAIWITRIPHLSHGVAPETDDLKIPKIHVMVCVD
jgi:predicted metal-dependent hydrolase